MRLFQLIAVSAILIIGSAANAIEFNVIGPSSFTVSPGATVTISFAVSNTSGDTVQGLVADLTGLSAAGLSVTSGESALHHMVGICATFVGGCAGGIDSVDNVFFSPFDLAGADGAGGATSGYTAGDDTVRVVSALALSSSTQAGTSDPGLDADINDLFNPSTRDVTISLLTSTFGTFMIPLVADFSDGTSTIAVTGTPTITITVPEPSAVAASLASLFTVAGVVAVRRRH